ncbi:MAG: hypothetical protein MJ212_06155, partial [Alphaproteobacteria bacterium]|nr:hypothetical protein [Alphaproteobacteria bacterium]
MSDVEINQYICKKQRLDELKTSEAKLIALAKRIKPLVRICKTYGNEYQKVVKIEDGDGLVFTRFCDITDSYFFHFKGKSSVVQHARRALAVKAPKKVGEFTCYFDFHGRRDFSPCLYDVLCQWPTAINIDKVNAFEVVFDSNDPKDAYDVLLDRYEG